MNLYRAVREAILRRHRLPLPVSKSGAARWVLDAIPEWTDRRVLDNGGGAGLFVRFWEEAGASVLCLDLDPSQMVAHTFVTGTALALPFRSGAFDTVLFLGVLEHLPAGTELSALMEMKRVLAPGGRLLLQTPSAHLLSRLTDPAWPFGHRHYSLDDLERLVTEADLQLEMATVLGGWFTTASILLMYLFKWGLARPVPGALRNWLDPRIDREWRTEGFLIAAVLARRR